MGYLLDVLVGFRSADCIVFVSPLKLEGSPEAGEILRMQLFSYKKSFVRLVLFLCMWAFPRKNKRISFENHQLLLTFTKGNLCK